MPPKHSLGKGLGAMFPDLLSNIGEKPAYTLCGIEELTPNRYQPRRTFDDADMRTLVASVKKSGIIQPIVVRKSETGYEIIAGERRWRAAQAAGLKDVPIVIRNADDRDAAVQSLIENLQREDLNPLEEANGYQNLMGVFSFSHEEIAAFVGKDRSTIANTVRLLKLPEAVKQALSGKRITAGHARALLAIDLPGEQIGALKVIEQKGLNVRDTERLIHHLKKASVGKRSNVKDPFLRDLERQLSSGLLTAVQIRPGKKGGAIEIRYSTNEELNRLARLLLER